ncbi:MAG: transketolase [Clostridia bacterium]|nr:transketolase [Clostridia bacterium]
MDAQKTTINALRILSAETVEKAKSGHPGLPMGCAPIGYTLFQYFLKFNPANLTWHNRDRFVLSAGHGSALLYSLFHLYGMGISMEDLKEFRQLGSNTPGHPEYGHTAGVETTTGPLGQGIANGVGMALAEAHLAAKYNRPGYKVVDHYTYVLCGDGCLEEGISYEACSFAGSHGLGKLILLYDDNEITIEGNTDLTFKENVGARFAAQNWQVLHVDLTGESNSDVVSLSKALESAKARTDKPSIIICKTNIGFGSPLQDSAKSHGAPLGAENLQKAKETLGWNYPAFECPNEVYEHCNIAARAGAQAELQWKKMFLEYEATYPELSAEYTAVMSGVMPNLDDIEDLYEFSKPMATRQTSAQVLNKIAAVVPQLVGGSADLTPSTLSNMKDTEENTYGEFSAENFAGRNIHFGIREHAMAAIANGMQVHGGIQAYCATFFAFSDYFKPAARLAALMKLPVTYILTHDSIGVGEDGPTHQPIEQLIMLRSIPGLKVFRPADGKETAAAWASALKGNQPTALVLTRQSLPQYENSGRSALWGGYILDNCEGMPDVLLIASGSEVELCVKAKAVLAEKGVKARVVSMPCMEEFNKQTQAYKDRVLPKNVKARVCVEAGSPYSWYKYAGEYGEIIAMDEFGASAPAGKLFSHFGFTVENVVEKALLSMESANATTAVTEETAEDTVNTDETVE